ncbi:MAG: hypothetical protein ACHQ0I_04280 [Candidatus Lutacidiplasmatales archaeon]
MKPSHPHRCEWSGISPDDGHVVMCDRLASGHVVASQPRPTFCCDEHIGWAKRVAGGGTFVRGVRADDRVAPFTHHATAQLDHGSLASFGEVY